MKQLLVRFQPANAMWSLSSLRMRMSAYVKFNLPVTGSSLFLGRHGSTDMALFEFTKAILNGQFIDVYNNGVVQRPFSYIGDIVEGFVGLLPNVPAIQSLGMPDA